MVEPWSVASSRREHGSSPGSQARPTAAASCGRELLLPRHPPHARHTLTREQELPPTRTAAALWLLVHPLHVCRREVTGLQYSNTPALRAVSLSDVAMPSS